MRIDKPKRKHRAAKRLDLTDIKSVLRDRRVWGAIGVVTAPTDGSQHWRIEMDGSNAVDVIVNVVTQPSGEQMECRLAAGMFIVPALDEEVAVFVPSGRIDFMPTIVGILSSNVVPTTQGPDPTRIVIVRGEVVIHDGNGGAKELAFKDDVDALAGYVDKQFSAVGHVHATVDGPTTSTTAGSTPSGGTAGVPSAAGTTILKAK